MLIMAFTRFFSSQVNGIQNPIVAAQNASSNTDGPTTEKAKNAAFAAGGAAAGAAGAAYAATKNAGSRAVGATSSNGTSLNEKSNAELQAEVKRLQSQVDSLRKSAAGQGTSEGIPIQIVAAICFGVFAFTYIFF